MKKNPCVQSTRMRCTRDDIRDVHYVRISLVLYTITNFKAFSVSSTRNLCTFTKKIVYYKKFHVTRTTIRNSITSIYSLIIGILYIFVNISLTGRWIEIFCKIYFLIFFVCLHIFNNLRAIFTLMYNKFGN